MAVALGWLSASACTTTGPSVPAEVSTTAGSYVLALINGAPLPVMTVPPTVGPNCTGITDSATLALKAPTEEQRQQLYELTMRAHFVCITGPDNHVTTGESGTWSVQGTTVTFMPTGAGLLDMSQASVSGTTLTISLNAPTYAPGNVGAARVTTEWRKQ